MTVRHATVVRWKLSDRKKTISAMCELKKGHKKSNKVERDKKVFVFDMTSCWNANSLAATLVDALPHRGTKAEFYKSLDDLDYYDDPKHALDILIEKGVIREEPRLHKRLWAFLKATKLRVIRFQSDRLRD